MGQPRGPQAARAPVSCLVAGDLGRAAQSGTPQDGVMAYASTLVAPGDRSRTAEGEAQERPLNVGDFPLKFSHLRIYGARVTRITTLESARWTVVPRRSSASQDLIFSAAVCQGVSARPMPAQAVPSRRRCRPTECQAVPGGPMFRDACFKYRTNLRSQPLGSCFQGPNIVPRRFGGAHRSPMWPIGLPGSENANSAKLPLVVRLGNPSRGRHGTLLRELYTDN